MSRVKRGVTKTRRHKQIVKAAKGYRGGRSKLYSRAKQAVMKAGVHAYVDRKCKKRTFRRLWITRLSAALKEEGMNYSRFIHAIAQKNVLLNRKILAELAVNHKKTFKEIVGLAKSSS